MLLAFAPIQRGNAIKFFLLRMRTSTSLGAMARSFIVSHAYCHAHYTVFSTRK